MEKDNGSRVFLILLSFVESIGIVFLDSMNIINWANERASLMLLTNSGLVGQPLEKYLSLEALNTEVFHIPHLDIYCINPIHASDQNKMLILLSSALVNSLAESQSSKELLQELNTIYDLSNDGLFVTDKHGITLKANRASEKFCCLSVSQLIGRDVRDLVAEGIFDPSVTLEVLKSKSPVTMMQNTKSGCRVIVTGTPVFDDDGNISSVICNTRDITALTELKEKLENTEGLVRHYKGELSDKHNVEKLNFRNETMQHIASFISRAAKVDATILLEGETGVGKNVLAKEIVRLSPRSKGPFIEINCGAIPPTLLESELFGYEKGAFTGANKEGKPGLIELANFGTLLLDEIGDLPLNLQVKLLRVIQDNQLYRIGSTKLVKVDIRVIAATNKDLKELVKKGEFREDLFYRINVLPIFIPPLRERKEDIPALIKIYLERFNKNYSLNKKLSSKTFWLLLNYHWPGNIRELVNVIERLVITAEEQEITPELLPKEILRSYPTTDSTEIIPLKEAVEKTEIELLKRAIKKTRTTYDLANVLGISQPSVVRKLKKYNLNTKMD
ncbi:MAG: sigma-54 interaction domain-containing protein [Desulfitobacteriaceae bacterium]